MSTSCSSELITRPITDGNLFGFIHGLLPGAPKYAQLELRHSIREHHIKNDFDFVEGNIFNFWGRFAEYAGESTELSLFPYNSVFLDGSTVSLYYNS